MSKKELTILLTNDDGIHSPGLWAAAQILSELGNLWIAAPDDQYTSAGRSHSLRAEGSIRPWTEKKGNFTAFAVDGAPAQCIHHGLLEILPCQPDLVVSGINSGSNVSVDITRSGTVGAALEAANYGIPALAISLETNDPLDTKDLNEQDYRGAAYFCRLFAEILAEGSLGEDVQVLKVEVPGNAVHSTPWEISRLSKKSLYIVKTAERSNLSNPGKLNWKIQPDFSLFKEGTDAHTVFIKEHIAVTPLSLDMTSRVDLTELEKKLVHRILNNNL
ncbi:MAG: 5'/3'-nucleotidase SurE [Spirochaetales bacterium]|nr:5'/3'-nucleotidase SurE [Spirochaetales bacterium]